jgi:hypothetical protein|tara:strand:- start:2930 stop:3265 length:336 start_codon:yes stop_codon:yes gene_type:complete
MDAETEAGRQIALSGLSFSHFEGIETAMTDTPPDRLSLNPRSRYYDPELIQRGVGVRFKGEERTNVVEYCLSEGWIKVAAGKSVDRKGNPLTLTLKGPVEVWFEDVEKPQD